ncbi:rhomboid family intramembrane serine protease [Gephyromycinifex aptenodytis]|uniref:rhomboid family intramembrane serine protease n=1 Tax=Gephyromycinifex aptenodytis TaxID=2716227 RepID=UPI001444C165|nr:rhomboid family intramembrane serine protease [Gephyromycinifex aptenodytis]
MSPTRPTSWTAARPAPRAWWRRVVPVLVMVALMWASEILDLLTPFSLDRYGIRPRHLDHLAGIVASPFLHHGFGHLIANTTALLILGALLALSTRHLWAVTIGVILLSGAGVWLTGASNSVHIGASGLVYGYAAFLAVYGFAARRLASALAGLLVIAGYGSLLWGVLPVQAGVSWQGHLFGALAGVALALKLGRRDRAGL